MQTIAISASVGLCLCFVNLSVCLFAIAYINKSSAVAEIGDRLATIDMDRKVCGGLLCPFPWGEEGELGPHLTQCRLGRDPSKFQSFGHNTPTLQTDRQDIGP